MEKLFNAINKTHSQRDLIKLLSKNSISQIKGIAGSGLNIRIASAFLELKINMLLIMGDSEEAMYCLNDLESFLESKNILLFPSSYNKSYSEDSSPDNSKLLMRSRVLEKITTDSEPNIIVTYPDALYEKIVTQQTLKNKSLKIKKGQEIDLENLNQFLFDQDFEKVDFVCEPGEFSIRGGIVDIFSFSFQYPYRIEFSGNKIESIRSFDTTSQLSIQNIEKIVLVPNISKISTPKNTKSILKLIPKKTSVICDDLDGIINKLEKLYTKIKTQNLEFNSTENLVIKSDLVNDLKLRNLFLINNSQIETPKKIIDFEQVPQPPINKDFNKLIEILNQNHTSGYLNYIFCVNSQQQSRLNEIFEEIKVPVNYKTQVLPLYRGFIDRESKIACFSDHQIFERYYRYSNKSISFRKNSLKLKELTSLKFGDFVTHIDHGIGKFGGLKKITLNKKEQETVKLIYGDGDILYLSIHSLRKITKYNSADGQHPKIYKLGSKAWKNLKEKTKKKIKNIAFNLIHLYAKRIQKIGHAFPEDSYIQNELEASFIYEDTPDQIKTLEEIKSDMENNRPMDRLVCGDVGFGKTEIAIRAAFKCVDDSKQVAVLVPTTILALQHFNTFSERLKKFPVRVNYLNRFKSKKEKNEILNQLEDGGIDIIIGTHQLVNKSIKFKDLGLLIVDEEQKFGVSVKEKLRDIKNNVDVLTLTATPIPRTLQFSLMKARDLSIISTPPPNRYPIESDVIRFNEEFIRDAINFEISRGGQIFFIHNRIQNISEISDFLKRLVPDSRIIISHGRMNGKEIEKNFLSFINGEFDILIATTIIENGLDVPNANTIFINDAQNFGLSDLHQMRGRVGRSNKKAFCFFITPEISNLTNMSKKRIKAIEEFSELGSGVQIAIKDLEIRGSGDLLGAEQSGFINQMGFETYKKILDEAIEEIKEEKFKSVFKTEDKEQNNFLVNDVHIDSDLELLFPNEYISVTTERLEIYKKLNMINHENGLINFKKELEDRFGKIPKQGKELINTVRLKWIASKLGIERIVIKNNECLAFFIRDKKSIFYKSEIFSTILTKVKTLSSNIVMIEKETRSGKRLIMKVKNISSINEIYSILTSLT
ncbi:MAG: transcription-repair coupling factor [Flavobacteriaceae bacterium]|nr:transcription-repair coupling factor [Flavobacteriaceae bacterium]